MDDAHAQSIDDLNFLPLKYRQHRTGRRATSRWLIAMAGCTALLAVVSSHQHQARKRLDEEVFEVQRQHQYAVAQTQTLATLEAAKRTLDSEAELVTYLRHPWPRTTLLAAVARAMPESVVLTEVKVTRIQSGRRPTANVSKPGRANESHDDKSNDLAELRSTYDPTEVHLAIEGITQDVAQLHSQFIGPLDESPLFETLGPPFVKLDEALGGGVSRFRVKFVVRQGYGQPKGPTAFTRTVVPVAPDAREGISWKE